MTKIRLFTMLLLLGAMVAGQLAAQTVDTNKKIVLSVKQGEDISLDFRALTANTKIKIESGTTQQEITVGTNWAGFQNYRTGGITMTITGALTGLDCRRNGDKITAIDVSGNTDLTRLYCLNNKLNSLDVSKNTALTELYCSNTQLKSLDVSKNTALTELSCSSNQLKSLDISENTALIKLYCYGNQLSLLDISKNTAIKELECFNNQLSSLDVSKNTALTKLSCSGNNFTTQSFNDLMCSLPARETNDNAMFYPLKNTSDSKAAAFQAANSTIAKNKNWGVLYAINKAIPATTGSYACPAPVDETKKIVLTVKQGQDISLNFQSSAENTKVRIESGTTQQEITVGTNWAGFQNYRAGGITMTITGALTGFDCRKNEEKITAIDVSGNADLTRLYCLNNKLSSLDVSKNTALTELDCSNTQLKSLDVSKNVALTKLSCSNNQLKSLNVSHNTALKYLWCYSTQLSSLDVSKNAALEELDCSSNQLKSLDVSRNTALTKLDCYRNQLSSLDVSKNTAIKELSCHGNNFTTQNFNDLMCSLPERQASDKTRFYPLYDASDSKATAFKAANSTIAKNKNWKVRYWNGDADTPATTGSYTCLSTSIVEASAPALSLYPNPVENVLYISTEEEVRNIYVYNVYGTEVASAAGAKQLSLRHLLAGVYLVRVETDKGSTTQHVVRK